MKKILFDRDSDCLQPLLVLIEKQKHRTLVLWALEYADYLLKIFEEKYPGEDRPRNAIEIGRAWAQGDVKMPAAKKAIHAAHNAATEITNDIVYCAVVRAIGHAVATIHVETHAIGAPIYALTAFAYANKQENTQEVVMEECDRLYKRLLYWEENIDFVREPWADFLLRGDIPNKERLLREKRGRQG